DPRREVAGRARSVEPEVEAVPRIVRDTSGRRLCCTERARLCLQDPGRGDDPEGRHECRTDVVEDEDVGRYPWSSWHLEVERRHAVLRCGEDSANASGSRSVLDDAQGRTAETARLVRECRSVVDEQRVPDALPRAAELANVQDFVVEALNPERREGH